MKAPKEIINYVYRLMLERYFPVEKICHSGQCFDRTNSKWPLGIISTHTAPCAKCVVKEIIEIYDEDID